MGVGADPGKNNVYHTPGAERGQIWFYVAFKLFPGIFPQYNIIGGYAQKQRQENNQRNGLEHGQDIYFNITADHNIKVPWRQQRTKNQA